MNGLQPFLEGAARQFHRRLTGRGEEEVPSAALPDGEDLAAEGLAGAVQRVELLLDARLLASEDTRGPQRRPRLVNHQEGPQLVERHVEKPWRAVEKGVEGR